MSYGVSISSEEPELYVSTGGGTDNFYRNSFLAEHYFDLSDKTCAATGLGKLGPLGEMDINRLIGRVLERVQQASMVPVSMAVETAKAAENPYRDMDHVSTLAPETLIDEVRESIDMAIVDVYPRLPDIYRNYTEHAVHLIHAGLEVKKNKTEKGGTDEPRIVWESEVSADQVDVLENLSDEARVFFGYLPHNLTHTILRSTQVLARTVFRRAFLSERSFRRDVGIIGDDENLVSKYTFSEDDLYMIGDEAHEQVTNTWFMDAIPEEERNSLFAQITFPGELPKNATHYSTLNPNKLVRVIKDSKDNITLAAITAAPGLFDTPPEPRSSSSLRNI